jgi:hypothetical protein
LREGLGAAATGLKHNDAPPAGHWKRYVLNDKATNKVLLGSGSTPEETGRLARTTIQ